MPRTKADQPAAPAPGNANEYDADSARGASVEEIADRILTAIWEHRLPPGIKLGPFSAPSSPPDTPVPTNNNPRDSTYRVRRSVSAKCVLPPSISTSPGSNSGISCSISCEPWRR